MYFWTEVLPRCSSSGLPLNLLPMKPGQQQADFVIIFQLCSCWTEIPLALSLTRGPNTGVPTARKQKLEGKASPTRVVRAGVAVRGDEPSSHELGVSLSTVGCPPPLLLPPPQSALMALREDLPHGRPGACSGFVR